MEKPFISDREFRAMDYTQKRLPKGEYEQCTFIGCDFSNGFLDNSIFRDCKFGECNISNANLVHATFSETTFITCKMIGLRFETCDGLFMSFSFDNCNLSYCSLYGLTLKNIRFDTCNLQEADFTNADLGGASFNHCNLHRAQFINTILVKSDFSTAYDFTIDPEQNNISKAKFSIKGLPGLLSKYGIVIERGDQR